MPRLDVKIKFTCLLIISKTVNSDNVHVCTRLDYCGIALLTMGSFVPWLYYSFYCRIEPKITYLALILVLGKLDL